MASTFRAWKGGDERKANKKRRKQERLKHRLSSKRLQGNGEPRTSEVCPLYLHPPEGTFYSSWIGCCRKDGQE
jgi:hypothetical protein